MNRLDIAAYLSRVLSAFRRDRLIRLRAVDAIEIVDMVGLEHLADCAA